ncbi:MAG: M3 family metallopeptidase [Ignavibacteriales bacterium]|nr:M3 family metallopeptidase [Ignavibacteriales bacterium]
MKTLFYLLVLVVIISPLSYSNDEKNMNNPFLKEWKTPFQTPPFNEIKEEHYLPAFEEGMKEQKNEVDQLLNSTEKPTFENTIDAMEKSGALLTRVSNVFFNLLSSNTNDEMQKIAQTVTPMLSKHRDDINLNEKLFERLKSIYGEKDKLNLTTEQNTLLEEYYSGFVRNGANLNPEEKDKLRKINEELSLLSLKFGDNILKETNSIGLVIDNKEDLVGLPDAVVQAALDMGKTKGQEGKWIFNLQKPSFIPFLQYSPKRELREKLFKAYLSRGNNNNDFDNKKVLSRIASVRVDRANLLGYKTHADYVLEKSMAKNPETVYKFLNDLWKPALKRSSAEVADMQTIIDKENGKFKLAAWDWWYYAEKVKKEKYNLDEEMLRPYFKLENVIDGVFGVATKLYGIQFVERKDIPVYHPDVRVFEVKEANGKHIAILYTDYFPRDSKRSGAWMSNFRDQSNIDGKFIDPIICNNGNFSKPTSDKPSLLSIDEVNTLFHEFGHAIHGMFGNTVYPSLSGTSVVRDFVELPSQIMENWAMEPEVLKMYAKHYKTGEPMPDELIKKIENSSLFNQGFESVEYLAASILDLDWHTLTTDEEKDAVKFEKESLNKIGLLPEIESRYQSTNFQHVFAGGYSAGYYSYIWAAVLDADAFQAFKEKGNLFDRELANSFRKNILEKGGSEEPMVLYKKFRGREPKVDALLTKRGLN